MLNFGHSPGLPIIHKCSSSELILNATDAEGDFSLSSQPSCSSTDSVHFCLEGKAFVPKERPTETHTEKKVTLDPELEEALASASDTELYDLAGVWQDLCACLFHSRVSFSVTPSLLPPQAMDPIPQVPLLSTAHGYGSVW